MISIDGKSYPLWSQFVERKNEWIGGTLEEFGDIFSDKAETIITDMTLEKNGDDSAAFVIHGKDFDELFDVMHGGISSEQPDKEWLYFSVMLSPGFRIKKPNQANK